MSNTLKSPDRRRLVPAGLGIAFLLAACVDSTPQDSKEDSRGQAAAEATQPPATSCDFPTMGHLEFSDGGGMYGSARTEVSCGDLYALAELHCDGEGVSDGNGPNLIMKINNRRESMVSQDDSLACTEDSLDSSSNQIVFEFVQQEIADGTFNDKLIIYR